MSSISRTSLTSWLVQRVAYYVERDPAEIDPTKRLTLYGMDSVYTLGLAGDIEEEFGVPVDATVAWDNPTIEAIIDYVLRAAEKSWPAMKSM